MTMSSPSRVGCPECGSPLVNGAVGLFCACCLLRLTEVEWNRRTVVTGLAVSSAGSDLLGGYRLLREIGRGGMGVVFEAEQLAPARRVAVKLILGGGFASEVEVARFNEEVDALASLDHPNIVPIYSVGEEGGQCFYSMKLLEAGSLETRWDSFVGRHRESVVLLIRIARAVHAAHAAGILHRDLKAGNILFDAKGDPYVTDFGLARFVSRTESYTASHLVPGTPDSLPPERISGTKMLTTACDVWSLGVLMYRLLSGRAPFMAPTIPDLLLTILERDPPLLPRSIDADLRTICGRCLEKGPEQRYSSAAAFADDLERWLEHLPILARRASMPALFLKWVRRKPWQAACAAALFAALVGPSVVATWFILTLNRSRGHHPLHPLVAQTNDLPILTESNSRITANLAGSTFDRRLNRRVRVEFVGIPEDVRPHLKVRFKSDWAVLDDPDRSPILVHGDETIVRANVERAILEDTFIYLESVGWRSREIIGIYPNAAIRLVLLDPER